MGSISPNAIQCDTSGTVTLRVFGSGFIGTDKINYEGSDITTVVVSATELNATLNPSGASPKHSAVKVTGDATTRYLNWTPAATFVGNKWFYDHPYW